MSKKKDGMKMADEHNERANNFHPEFLRPVEHVCEPDPRNLSFVRIDPETGDFVPLKIHDHYKAVSQIKLTAKAPEDVVFQFETARNLYLYAWFIYRFYPVAAQQSLACLELALRKRYKDELPKEYLGRAGKPTLKPLLRYAVDRGYIKNEGFQRWHESSQRRATARYRMEKIDEMYEKGLKSIDLDYLEVAVTDADRNWGYLNVLLENLPELRNHYAHGTAMLDNQVLGTIELVSEMINQIYPAE